MFKGAKCQFSLVVVKISLCLRLNLSFESLFQGGKFMVHAASTGAYQGQSVAKHKEANAV